MDPLDIEPTVTVGHLGELARLLDVG